MKKVINYLIILYALSIPISRASVVFFGIMLLVLWIVYNRDRFIQKIKKIFNIPVFFYLFLFLGFSILSLLWSEDIRSGLKYLLRYWYILPSIVIYDSLDKKYIKPTIFAFLIGMLISEIISYGIFFRWWQFKNIHPNDPSPFMNHLQYSMFLAWTSLLLLNRFFVVKDIKMKLFFVIYSIFVTANLFINGGRTGQVAFIVSIFIFFTLNIKSKLKAIVISSITITAIVTTAYNLNPIFKYRSNLIFSDLQSSIYKQNFNTSIGTRLSFWLTGSKIIKENPIIGVGVGDGINEVRKTAKNMEYDFKEMLRKEFSEMHNDTLHITTQLGIIGLILYLMFIYKVATIRIKDKNFSKLPTIFISVYFISSMFDTMFHQLFTLSLMSLFIGIFLKLSYLDYDSNNNYT